MLLHILQLTEQTLNALFMTGSEYFNFVTYYCVSVDKFREFMGIERVPVSFNLLVICDGFIISST